MNRPWPQFGAELSRRGKSIAWLAQQLGCSIQRVQNWTTRGVPPSAFPEVARAFDESIDWVAGTGPPKAKKDLSPEAREWGALYDGLSPTERQRWRLLYQVARDGVQPDIKPAADASQPTDDFLGGTSGLGALDPLQKKKHK